MSEEQEDSGIGHRLRSRYMYKIAAAVIVVALVLTGLGWWTFTGVQASVSDDAESSMLRASEREAAGIQQFAGERSNITQRIANEEGIGSMSDQQINATLADELRRAPSDVVALHYYNIEQQTVEISTNPLAEGVEVSAEQFPWVEAARQATAGEVRSLEPNSGTVAFKDGNEKQLGFVAPVENRESHAIVLVVDLEARSSLLTSPVEGGKIHVVSYAADGQIVLAEDLTTILDQHPLVGELDYLTTGDVQAQTDQVTAQTDLFEDENLVVASAEVPGDKRWLVTTTAERSTVFDTVSEVSRSLLILIVVSLLGLVVLGAAIIRDINRSLNQITVYAEEIEDGNLGVDIEQSRVDEFGQLSVLFSRIRDSLEGQIREAEQAQKEAEVARAEAEELARHLQEKAEEYSEVMQQVAAGDMTQRMQQDGEEESMDQIAAQFNEMIEELEKTTGQLKSYVDEVEAAGAEVEQSSRTVREASEQVAESIQKISDDAYDQKDRLDELRRSMEETVERIEDIAAEHDNVSVDDALAQIREVAEELDEIAELSQETMAESQEVAGAAEEQAAELNTVSDRANDLQRYAQPLRDILERFETEEEHEFVFSVGPTGGAASPEEGPGDDA
ncbi:HAMP domain-containing protein [Halovenus sp. WSH3]|uniref:HAMP domain-containing protein n=1 Tax=Halovenus carboxidivorans TaxID=2692199 RepID=A0A6B0T6X1_9EURY|nr:methyl-accepting chemotaxis protein [Halovenus carboxidivorans]MXR51956.1 HAMP domain-containing protein [Halovenus carboxidivorans]